MTWSTDTTISVVTLLATGPSSILVLWKFFRNRRKPSHANCMSFNFPWNGSGSRCEMKCTHQHLALTRLDPLEEFEEPARSPSTNLTLFNLSRAGSDPHCLYPSGLDVEAGLAGLLVGMLYTEVLHTNYALFISHKPSAPLPSHSLLFMYSVPLLDTCLVYWHNTHEQKIMATFFSTGEHSQSSTYHPILWVRAWQETRSFWVMWVSYWWQDLI